MFRYQKSRTSCEGRVAYLDVIVLHEERQLLTIALYMSCQISVVGLLH